MIAASWLAGVAYAGAVLVVTVGVLVLIGWLADRINGDDGWEPDDDDYWDVRS